MQVSQYTFAMCSYREKKAEPVELLQLDGYTVDYTDPQPGNVSHTGSVWIQTVLTKDHQFLGHATTWVAAAPGGAYFCVYFVYSNAPIQAYVDPSGLDGGRTFFNAVKEGDTVIFASDDEQDRILWVQAMYRATGQSHKPVPPTQVQKLNSRGGTAPQLDAPISQFCKSCIRFWATVTRGWWFAWCYIDRLDSFLLEPHWISYKSISIVAVRSCTASCDRCLTLSLTVQSSSQHCRHICQQYPYFVFFLSFTLHIFNCYSFSLCCFAL